MREQKIIQPELRWFRTVLLTVTLMWSVAVPAFAASDFAGVWQGRIDLPNQPLDIEVIFSGADNQLTGRINIPAQRAKNLPLENIEVRVSAGVTQMTFAIAGVPGDPSFIGEASSGDDRRDSMSIAGLFSQSGGTFAFTLTPVDPIATALDVLRGFSTVADEARTNFDVPGAGIAIVYRGEVIFSQGFGLRDVKQNLPMTGDTLFAIGSTTKAMTATVLGMLADERILSWDDKVRQHLPAFNLEDESVAAQLTVRDLVTHRSGMPRHDLMWYNNTTTSREQAVERLAYLEITAAPRTRFQYNNLMFMAAGYLGAKVAGYASWEDLMRARLLEPLVMHRSNFAISDMQKDANYALPYYLDHREVSEIPFRPVDLIGPAGSVNSSVNEMANWLKLNLANGVFAGINLISADGLKDVHAHHMPTGQEPVATEFSPPVYGLGWMVGTYQGKKHLYHSGGIDGFITNVMLFPNDDLGMVAFTNANSDLAQWLNLTAADLLLGHVSKDWLGQALQRKQNAASQVDVDNKDPRQKAKTKPSHQLNAYAGEYFHRGYGVLDIRVEGKNLSLQFNDMPVDLEHWHFDVWRTSKQATDRAMRNHLLQFQDNFYGDVAMVQARIEPTAAPVTFEKRTDSKLTDEIWLAQWVGDYVTPQIALKVIQRKSQLFVVVPGQPTHTLVPELGGRFHFEQVPDVTVQFDESNSTMLLMQPSGVTVARKN